jgi:hypothetical protein
MLADVNLIPPVRGTEPAKATRRRRDEEKNKRKVQPRRQNSRALNEDQGGPNKGAGLDRFA